MLASHWGDAYYHFVSESLPRIVLVLDMLLEHEDIKVRFAADLYVVGSARCRDRLGFGCVG